jgi:hypothetical protein
MSKSPERKMLEWLKLPHIRPYALAALLTAITLAQSRLDPFGLISTTDQVSGLLVSTALSPFYGATDPIGQDNIVVVLYDEPYFSQHKITWPLEPDRHLELIEIIAAANPAGIFLDVYFTSQNQQRAAALEEFYSGLNERNCSDDDGKNHLENCKADLKAPIFLASLLSDPAPSITLNNATSCPPRKTLAETTESKHLYRLQELDAHNTDKDSCSAYNGTTAAYDLYQAWCHRQNLLETGSCEPLQDAAKDKLLYLQWGFAPDQRFYRSLLGNQDKINPCAKNTSTLSALYHSVKLTLSAAIGRPSNAQELCPYTNYVGAGYIQQAPPGHLKELLQNKVVMIGVSDNPIPDRIESNVQGHLPGVFWHAAALDNLMEHKNRFIQKKPEDHQTLSESIVAILLFFLFAAFIHKNGNTERQAKLYSKNYSQTPKPIYDDTYNKIISERRSALITGMHLSTGLIGILLLTVLITTIWVMADYAPENWIGTATLLLILSSGETKAMGRVSQRIAFLMIDFTAQPLASIVQKSLDTASKRLPPWIQKTHFDPFTPVAIIIRVVLFFTLTIAVFILILAMGALVFFAPIVYFSVSLTDWSAKVLFIIGYTGLIYGSYRYWHYCTKKLWTNNLNRPPSLLKRLKSYRFKTPKAIPSGPLAQ